MEDCTELRLLETKLLQPCGVNLTDIAAEPESREYAAHQFRIKGRNVKFRKAKITPAKVGQFVTVWKRNREGVTEPFNISDAFDLVIVATKKDDCLGFFIFPKAVLHEHGIVSDKSKEGKRGIRVYPPWDLTESRQARKTQQWQVNYFIDLSKEKQLDLKNVKDLLRS